MATTIKQTRGAAGSLSRRVRLTTDGRAQPLDPDDDVAADRSLYRAPLDRARRGMDRGRLRRVARRRSRQRPSRLSKYGRTTPGRPSRCRRRRWAATSCPAAPIVSPAPSAAGDVPAARPGGLPAPCRVHGRGSRPGRRQCRAHRRRLAHLQIQPRRNRGWPRPCKIPAPVIFCGHIGGRDAEFLAVQTRQGGEAIGSIGGFTAEIIAREAKLHRRPRAGSPS